MAPLYHFRCRFPLLCARHPAKVTKSKSSVVKCTEHYRMASAPIQLAPFKHSVTYRISIDLMKRFFLSLHLY